MEVMKVETKKTNQPINQPANPNPNPQNKSNKHQFKKENERNEITKEKRRNNGGGIVINS